MGHKILLVDDDVTLLELLGEYLEEEGYTVIRSDSGMEGIRNAYQEHPDLIVLDVMMPRMDGWLVAQRLREMADVPLIMLTAKTTEHDKLRGFQLGADDYVTKPFSFAELTARIEALLSRIERTREAPTEPHQQSIGDLEIDFDMRRVLKAGQPINLTPTEFRLLRCLALNMGRALSQERILEEVWGPSVDYTAGYVRRYVWYLRQKLEDDPDKPHYIHTERGFGYRFGLD